MITIEIDPSLDFPLDPDLLERAAQATLDLQSALDADLTVVVTVDERIRGLNREYREVDAATDVLAFPAGEPDPESGRLYLGDVVISLPRAESQAAAGGHELGAELQLLVVHGVLHLLGHDHSGVGEKELMWSAQAAVLDYLDLPPSIVHE
jgi:probable rRNA maturation factor